MIDMVHMNEKETPQHPYKWSGLFWVLLSSQLGLQGVYELGAWQYFII
jgi:hypothetical protein